MAEQDVVILGPDGKTEHVFPPGFDPQKAAEIVRGQSAHEPDTYWGGFLKSAGQTAAETGKGVGEGVLSSLNPINLVTGPIALGTDLLTNQGHNTIAGLKAIASGDPRAGGNAIGSLLVAGAVPRVAGAIRSRMVPPEIPPPPSVPHFGGLAGPEPRELTRVNRAAWQTAHGVDATPATAEATPAAAATASVPAPTPVVADAPVPGIQNPPDTSSAAWIANKEAILRRRAAIRPAAQTTPDLSGSVLGQLPNDAEMVADLQRRAAAGGKSLLGNFGPGGPLGPEGGYITPGLFKLLTEPKRTIPALVGGYLSHKAGLGPYAGMMVGAAAPEIAASGVKAATSPYGQAALRAAILAKLAEQARQQDAGPPQP